MRILGLNLLVAFALFGVAYANSDREQVKDAYRAYVAAYASGNATAICAVGYPTDLGPGEPRAEQVEDCVERYNRFRASPRFYDASPRFQTLSGASVVVTDLDDDHATVMPRVRGCTLEVLAEDFQRADDGRWYEHTISNGSGPGHFAPCKERGEVPPPQLAWTFNGRKWR